MSSRRASFPIEVVSPCEADWDSMIGNEQVRFCAHCNLSVHQISSLDGKQLRKLIAQSQGRLCVRYVERHSPPLLLHKIGRRTAAIAAGAFSASLGLSTALGASYETRGGRFSSPASAVMSPGTNQGAGSATLKGIIFDPQGAVISGALVSVTNVETHEVTNSNSDGSGSYKIANLPPGIFNLKIVAAGFAASDVPLITLRANDEHRIDQTLSIAPINAEVEITAENLVTMGAAVVVTASVPLVKAAEEDNLDDVRQVLLEKPDANVRDPRTEATALEAAVRNGNREMVQLLLWAKADVNAKDRSGQTALMMLGEQATAEIVWDLLNAGAKLNLRDHDGETALMSSAQVNNAEILKVLLDAGARVNGSNNSGQTALMLAASAGFANNVRVLLLAGAEVNVRDKNGKSALSYAEENGNRAAARILKSFGAIAFEQEERGSN